MSGGRDRSDVDEGFSSNFENEQETRWTDLEELDELSEGMKSQRDDAHDPRRRRRRLYRDDKGPFILEINDETDNDIMSVLLEEQLPEGIRLTTCQRMIYA